MTDATLEAARESLHEQLRQYDSLAVAYSGGVDSAYLAWEAHQLLGARMVAILADSPSLPRTHLAYAMHFAQQHSIPLRIIQTAEMQRPDYIRNDRARCFHCKDELFTTITAILASSTMQHVAYGRNRDDDGDVRPGQRAASLHGVVAPLADAGLVKQEIRALAHAAALDVWDRPASACLSSRIEYGRPVTREALAQVEAAEEHLHALGFTQVRVRHHGEHARVEIDREELPRALTINMQQQIIAGVRASGFLHVTIDPEGYRSGSMNTLFPITSLTASRPTHAA